MKGGNTDSYHHETWRMLLIRLKSGGAWLWPVARDSDLHNIESMDFDMVRTTAWPPVTQNVVWLDISNTGLKLLPDALWELKSLHRLELHCNALVVVPDGIAELLQLDYLSLHSNAISAISPQLTRLMLLRFLTLNCNMLTQPPALPPNLQRLSMHQNKIAALPEGLGLAGADLRALALHGNQISHIPASMLSSIPRCEVFTLQRNALTAVPETLGDMSGLSDLWLYSNQLTSLPSSIGRLRSLKRL